MTALDISLFHTLNGWMEGGREFWTPWAMPAMGLVFAGVVLASAIWERRHVAALLALVAVGITDPTCSYGLKPLFGRERPCAEIAGVHVPATDKGAPICGSGKAMPSNHAANTMAVAVATANPLFGLLSLFVGLSRVVTGQHWPTDVLAGWTIGAGIGWAVRAAASRLVKT